MLILTRKPGEKILIGDNIELTLIDIRGNQARIGFAAPTNTTILRYEVFERIQEENKIAANSALDSSELDKITITSTSLRKKS